LWWGIKPNRATAVGLLWLRRSRLPFNADRLAQWQCNLGIGGPERKWRRNVSQIENTKAQGMTMGEVIVGHYDYRLVALSVLIGVIREYCTIELAESAPFVMTPGPKPVIAVAGLTPTLPETWLARYWLR
jgi:hypothetical protein